MLDWLFVSQRLQNAEFHVVLNYFFVHIIMNRDFGRPSISPTRVSWVPQKQIKGALKDMVDRKDKIHTLVIEKYSEIAKRESGGCTPSCCGGDTPLNNITEFGKMLGYQEEDLLLAPGEANLGLGCGNPLSVAELRPGEVVLDLGSGAGFDAFLAAKKVGTSGKVIGMDMTLEMVQKATQNAEKLEISNVEFRQGKIEALPVSDDAVDVVISNCVINLSPDKSAVFEEIYRTLKPGGRIVISDVLRSGEIPEELRNNPAAYTG
jgi:2-polyprenyl-3-methyl-5-hydroxy-6-metoxy-1,4-benzoquinol methylase